MSPLRAYRCANGHEWNEVRGMSQEHPEECSICESTEVEPVLQPANSHVKGGTPKFWGKGKR